MTDSQVPSGSGSSINPKQLPYLGVGVGLRRELLEGIKKYRPQIDFVEVISENYMGRGGYRQKILEETMALGLPIILHGVNLSLGSIDPFHEQYLSELGELLDYIRPAWFSDHLCFTAVDGVYLNDLIPLPMTWETVEHVVKRIQFIQQRFSTPFLIENASCYAQMAPAEMTEPQFLSEIVQRSGCGLMLDVNNIYVNSQNFGFDPIEFLEQLPLDKVVQVHIAGHLRKPNYIVDTHGADICPEVYDILEELLKRTPVNGILLERDQHIPAIESLLEEIAQIRAIVDRTGRAPQIADGEDS